MTSRNKGEISSIGFKISTRLVIALVTFFLPAVSWAASVFVVPEGNEISKQPDIPYGSTKRTTLLATSYQEKYSRIFNLLKQDARLINKIKKNAGDFHIDPIHLIGAIVGEHTFNVDVYDQLQTYYIKAVAYFNHDIRFKYNNEDISKFVARKQFSQCFSFADSYRLWTCRELVWNEVFRGRMVEGVQFPDDRFSAVFFQPFFAGQTFGLGQVNPLTALMVTDRVHEVTGLPRLSAANATEVYKTIMNPDLTLPYIAAILEQSIVAYRNIANFDISHNVGLTATLYNTGGAVERASKLAVENQQRSHKGLALRLPQVNYYGWFVNSKRAELQQLVE